MGAIELLGRVCSNGQSSFQKSENDYDWLGPGIYFWEANPRCALEFAGENAARKRLGISRPFVVGAVIDLGSCLDLTTSTGLDLVRAAYGSQGDVHRSAGRQLPKNSEDPDQLLRNLHCAVIRRLHSFLEAGKHEPIDTVKGVFTEGAALYAGPGFREKTHTQIAVCNPLCIKGIFRVPAEQMEG